MKILVQNADRLVCEWVAGELQKPFKWGIRDCGTITLKVLEILHGENLFPELPRWSKPYEAKAVYSNLGSPTEFLEKHGFQEVSINYAQLGDIVLLISAPFQTFCPVIPGHKILIVDPVKGLCCQDISSILVGTRCFVSPRNEGKDNQCLQQF